MQDFDEFLIPARVPEVIESELFSWRFWRKSFRFRQRLSYYHLNLMSEGDWTLGFACLGRMALDPGFSANRWRHVLAKKRSPLAKTYLGWHHSYLGDVNFIKTKIRSFAEAHLEQFKEITEEQIQSALDGASDLFGRDFRYYLVNYENLDPIPALLNRRDLMKDPRGHSA